MLSKLHSRSAATANWPGTCYYKALDSSPFVRKLSTVATKQEYWEFLCCFLFFLSLLSILTPTLVLPVQRLLFLSQLVDCTAPHTKPLTGTSENDVKNSEHSGLDRENKGFGPLLVLPEGALTENK